MSSDDIRTMITTDTPVLLGALCAGRAPGWDLDVHGESDVERTERHAAALRACQRCPVIRACRAWGAQAPRARYGVWGGRLHIERPRRTGPERPATARARPAAGEPTPDSTTAA